MPSQSPHDALNQFRGRVLAAHASAFRLHGSVMTRFEAALLQDRQNSGRCTLALDMLMYQAFKSGNTVSLLAQHGLLEDAATIARRLMELAVQALYLWADGDVVVQQARASRYLAHMWRHLPDKAREKMPEPIRRPWQEVDAEVGDSLAAGAMRWGPRWKDMFAAVGASDMYDEDYSLLSSMAHGSPDDLVLEFSSQRIKMHRYEGAWVLLWYATKYFVIVAGMWNNAFGVLPDAEIQATIDRVNSWKRPTHE